MNPIRAAGATTALAVSLACAAPAPDVPADFSRHWHDGKAEVSGYRYEVTRYGERRTGQAVAVYVTEPFSASRLVKVEDPERRPADTFDALKLNLVRDFQTGIYDYNTMVSVFVRTADLTPVKISFSSAEWCGHVYEELRVDEQGVEQQLRSYFEDESVDRRLDLPQDGVFEDELFVRLRGLRGEYLKPGETRQVPFLASTFHRRLTHRPAAWSVAEIERRTGTEEITVPAGTFATSVYVVRPADGREGRFWIEAAYPHRIVRWSWRATGASRGEALDEGELRGSERLAYWTLNRPGGERSLRGLGVAPLPEPPAR